MTELREEIKKYIDKTDDKTLEIVFHILEASNESNDILAEMSKEQEASLKRSLEQADKGMTVSNEEVMKKYAKWLKQ